jgi:aminoglycoside phosphotransferase (APT) family kinase protein
MSALVRHLPRLADDLLELEARTAPVIADLPSVLRHGDLWRGNLLVDHERLIGVVDWDTWHPDGVPGTDLLHLVAFARALATRRSLAEVLSQRPWEDELFAVATRRYWTEMGFHPSRDILEAIAVASWAGHTVANLDRYPESVSDDVWLGQHVKPLLRPLRS